MVSISSMKQLKGRLRDSLDSATEVDSFSAAQPMPLKQFTPSILLVTSMKLQLGREEVKWLVVEVTRISRNSRTQTQMVKSSNRLTNPWLDNSNRRSQIAVRRSSQELKFSNSST